MSKADQQDIHGVLILDKPIGLSSNQALQRVKKILNAKKAGHTGSLDVLASGLLPICLGRATKFSQFLLNADKTYYVTAKLGEKTKTGDTEGEIVEKRSCEHVTKELLQQTLEKFVGEIEQIPSMYSALKYQGKPLYQLARKGIEIEREPRKIQIYSIRLLRFKETGLMRKDEMRDESDRETGVYTGINEDFERAFNKADHFSWKSREDQFSFEVHCSKGTYVRTLVEDIGEKLKCGAHVTQLRRSKAGHFQSSQMHTLEAVEKNYLKSMLLPVSEMLMALPELSLNHLQIRTLRLGRSILLRDCSPGIFRLMESDRIIGVGEVTEEGKLLVKRFI